MLDLNDLYQYQRDIANHILNHRGSFIVCEMGLGKTISSLIAVQWLQQNSGFGPALVLAPLRVVYNSWPCEVKKWAQCRDMKYSIVHGDDKKRAAKKKVDIYLSNFESIDFIIEDTDLFSRCEILIIDESSKVKNHSTKRFKKLKKIAGNFKKVICLTGTPSQSGELTELFSQVYLLDNGERLGKSFHQYKNRYYQKADYMGYKWELKTGSRQAIENKIRDISIVLKAQDHLKMPHLSRNIIDVSLPTHVMAQYREIEKEFLLEINKEVITVANAAVLSGKLRQITAGGIYHPGGKDYTILHTEKMTALEEIIEESEGNIMCAFQFRFEKYLLKQSFPGAVFLDGETDQKTGQRIINAWNDKKIKLLCVHPQSVGHGLNIQAGGHVLVWLSPDWSLERTQQMDARVFRQGQLNNVIIHTIACRDTVDHTIIESLQNKSEGQNTTINALKRYASRILGK